ncbi:hypothetical protein [Spiroplasma turonicum]|uniref:Uncharacterized protein n=1 Tax=Spiroplasma turonicum TaxID=216946 RepID=A0A0K1P7E6_9MOLU|nr:hypothetical protein [Spiroplasma turonicum]AKU79827.1 hypothetical protein STURON_00581 [Spiroplasma turonicum]ALX70842.1 hypothetical protein STURO_v1c05760 [Spiroplasma turonicum]
MLFENNNLQVIANINEINSNNLYSTTKINQTAKLFLFDIDNNSYYKNNDKNHYN